MVYTSIITKHSNRRLVVMQIEQLETPVALVDLDRLEANIQRFQTYLSSHNLANRPHIKTHKIPAIAHMQLAAGAIGITCQKLGEAEVMAAAGISDIFLPYNILGTPKLTRLFNLVERTRLSVTADSATTVAGLAAAAQQAGQTLTVLVECDTGAQRCGVQTPAAAADLARQIASAAHLHFGGLMTYPFNEQTDPFVEQTRALLAHDQLAIERVSIGGTGNMWRAHSCQTATEYRAGMYIYGDRICMKHGAITLDDCALSVVTTVVSRPTTDRGILDGGSKTFSSDLLGLEGHGLLLEYPEARFYGMSEEHGHVDFSACDRRPVVGERVTVIPNHCCVVSNLFNQIVGVRGTTVEVTWPVAARGLVQ
jgi:D-serine deaminase-like pyridoxal phosphate-dependent protein